MSTCAQCGSENSPSARFCVKCGAALEVAAQPAPPPQQVEPPVEAAAPPVPPPAAATPPTATPPPAAAVTPPAAPPQAAPPVAQPPQPAPYAQPAPGAALPPTYQMAQPYARPAKTKGALFWVGGIIVLISGVLILISTWMSWGSGPAGFLSLSGWDWFDIGKAGGGSSGEIVNAFFVYSESYPIFTGLCSLIVGGVIALFAGLILVFRSKGFAVLAIIFSIIALGMAVTNLTTIVRTENISMGIGMYVFLVFSLLGLVGGGMSMSG